MFSCLKFSKCTSFSHISAPLNPHPLLPRADHAFLSPGLLLVAQAQEAFGDWAGAGGLTHPCLQDGWVAIQRSVQWRRQLQWETDREAGAEARVVGIVGWWPVA